MISLCITTFNRTELLFDSFRNVINDDRISEIVIVDDKSDDKIYQTVAWFCKDIDKVKLYRNDTNLDCYRNKRQAVKKASNEWVILFDSDNILTTQYVDCLKNETWTPDTILQPQAARPHFDFTKYAGLTVDRTNVSAYMEDATFQTMLNAMNYFVNRDEYLRVWDKNVDPVTSDSFFQNYNWLAAGNHIKVVPGMEYTHRVNDHKNEEISHYAKNHRRTPQGFHDDILTRLKQMR